MTERRPTLLRRLLLALLPALLAVAAAGAAFDYVQVRRMTDKAYDQALGGIAIGVAARLEGERDNDLAQHLSALTGGTARRRYLVVDREGRILAGDARLAIAAPSGDAPNPAFDTVELDGQALRMARYRYLGPDGEASIVVAEPLDARRASVRSALRLAMWTNLALVAAVLFVVAIGVKAALVPLHRLGTRYSRQDVERLRPLDDRGVPQELQPLVDGMNHLVHRLRAALQAEQAFLSAAAHQLRTPLAGLRARLDVMLDDAAGQPYRADLLSLREPVERMTRLTGQMLALARTEADMPARQPVDLVTLLQEVASERLDEALARDIDLGLDAAPASVEGQHWMLREMLLNLLDNALRYAPSGSAVTLRCGSTADAAFVEVDDAGPGIPPAERERVFERFVRLDDVDRAGSGLGLAIVREAARRHGAVVRVLDGPEGRGTRMRVEFARTHA